jgi:hypothetical protein
MSALWHDPEFEPVRQFEAPLVQRNFDDLPVPTEKHELPDGFADPFAKLDAVYDAVEAQNVRGLEGSKFLHGNKPPAALDPAFVQVSTEVVRSSEKPVDPARQTATTLDRQTREHIKRLDTAANQPTVQASTATKTAAQKEVEKATNAGAGSGSSDTMAAAMTFAPMVAAQVAASSVSGPLAGAATQATQALQTANSVAAAAEVALVGVADATAEKVDTVDAGARTPRRGLSKKS